MQLGNSSFINKTGTAPLMRFLPLFCLMSGLAFAETWSGTLVDAGCYQSAKNNRNAYAGSAVRDVGMDVRMCTPKAKTRSFAIMQPDSEDAALDAAEIRRPRSWSRRKSGKSRRASR